MLNAGRYHLNRRVFNVIIQFVLYKSYNNNKIQPVAMEFVLRSRSVPALCIVIGLNARTGSKGTVETCEQTKSFGGAHYCYRNEFNYIKYNINLLYYSISTQSSEPFRIVSSSEGTARRVD